MGGAYGHTRGMSLEPMLGYGNGNATVKPRFNVPSLDLDFLVSPSKWAVVQYRLWPLYVFGPVVGQTFLDLNTIYCLVQYVFFRIRIYLISRRRYSFLPYNTLMNLMLIFCD